MENISRRNLVKGIGLGTAAVAAASLAPTSAHAKADPSYAGTVDVPSFLIKPEPISDVAETKDFDVVVVGAGAAGVTATLAAVEAGAKVACLQKESTAISQGSPCRDSLPSPIPRTKSRFWGMRKDLESFLARTVLQKAAVFTRAAWAKSSSVVMRPASTCSHRLR